MMTTLHRATLGFCAATLLSACSTVTYLESETPAGAVPPPPLDVVEPVISQGVPELPSEAPRRPSYQDREMDRAMARQDTIRAFQQAYSQMGRPRLALYLNRELSAEVREWTTQYREVISAGFDDSRQNNDGSGYQRSALGGAARYAQTREELPERESPSERWMWAFEDGFLRPFLEAGADIVDRNVIMRASGARTGQPGQGFATQALKTVEMDALDGFADLLVEALIARSPGARYGYQFKASAKNVANGVISANVVSAGEGAAPAPRTSVKATSRGYQYETTVELPSVDAISEALALDLMSALSSRWR